MSQFGFDKVLANLEKAERQFLKRGIQLAQSEFRKNFNSERNSETGESWDMVIRAYPPPILDVTGQLRGESLHKGNVVYTQKSAILTINPVDDRGREYAAYHEEGTDIMAQREFVTQSDDLTNKQEKALITILDKLF